MVNKETIKKLVSNLKITSKDVILEIGPGTGNLTKDLYKKSKKLILVEKDKKFVSDLKKSFPQAQIINGDIILIKIPEFTKLISNLPYNICEPFFWRLPRLNFKTAVFTIPVSFANLLQTDYTPLGLLTKAIFNIKIIVYINRSDFEPIPRTDSCIIKLTKKKTKSKLKELFLQSDKKLKNSLLNLLTKKGLTKNQARRKIMFLPNNILNKKPQNLTYDQIKKIENII